ncbi:MAG: hypothetical protein Q9168_004514 [Polycauliona sp. 1 TL-2023]
MRSPRWIALASTSFLARHTLASFSINLSELQPISGFSDACTEAYNAPLSDCTLSDFYQGSTCSSACVNLLEDMTKRLNEDCKGITAFPNTLIGMFFKETAVQQLCPGGTSDVTNPAETATAESTSSSSSRLSTSTTSTFIETATLTTTSITSSAAPSSTLSTRTSVVPSSTASAGQGSDDGSATVTAGASPTTSASDAQGISASTDPKNSSGGNGGNDANGGTVLEAASMASVKSIPGLSLITACIVLAMCAL